MIRSAKDIPLNQNSGTLPDVSAAMLSWFQSMTFLRIVKTVVNFKVRETPTSFSFRGVIQPYTAEQIAARPEGQRDWKWHTLHAQPDLVMDNDEVITYLGKNYRVKDKTDYTAYGYIEYHLQEDYTGAGP